MRFIDVLYAYLSTYTGLTALVGTAVYPNRVAQDTPVPYVAMEENDREKIYVHGGYCGSSIYSYQLSAYADTKDQVELIAQQIAEAMAAWRAVNNAIGYAIEKGESDAYRQELGDAYQMDLNYNIFYNE